MKKILKILLFSFLISIPVILPYFHKGYFPTHDGEWAVVRLGDMFRTIRDFQIPARYSGELNFGYGYPLFNFAYPSPYYLGVLMHFFGVGFVDSIKFIFAASVFFSGFFMFLASRTLWKSTMAGVISTIFYIYFPYRMVDLYVRGSIGESLAFVLFPLLFYLAIKLIDKPSPLLIGSIAVSVAFLIMTHNIMTVLFMPTYIVFTASLVILKNKKAIKTFFLSIVLGLGLSAFFWIPSLLEKSNILLSKIPIADRSLYFVTFDQFLFPRWGYGSPTNPDGFSYQMGLVHLATFLIVVLYLLFIFIKYKHAVKEYYVKIAILFTFLTLFFTFLLFKPSNFLWENLPLLSEINYPWIVLGILGFLISLLAGFICKHFAGRYVMVFLGVIAVVIVLPYAKPEYYIDKGDTYYLTNHATTTSSNELMPLWVKQKPTVRYVEKVEILEGVGTVRNVSYNSKKITFNVEAKDNMKLKINTIYYPGWKVSVDKTDTIISYSNEKGVMDISVPAGKHLVKANFTETPLRATSNAISLLSLFALLFLGIKSLRKSPSV